MIFHKYFLVLNLKLIREGNHSKPNKNCRRNFFLEISKTERKLKKKSLISEIKRKNLCYFLVKKFISDIKRNRENLSWVKLTSVVRFGKIVPAFEADTA